MSDSQFTVVVTGEDLSRDCARPIRGEQHERSPDMLDNSIRENEAAVESPLGNIGGCCWGLHGGLLTTVELGADEGRNALMSMY